METKYSEQNVRKALEPWASYKNAKIKMNEITSRLYSPDSQTVFFVNKKYPLYNYRLLPSHVFTRINGKVFHPGSSDTDIFVDEETRTSTIVSVDERCYKCTYESLQAMFQRDKNFNIFTNNCQVIMGQPHETYLLLLAFVFAILYVISGSPKFVLGTLSIFIYVILYEKLSSSIDVFRHSTCPHIKTLSQLG